MLQFFTGTLQRRILWSIVPLAIVALGGLVVLNVSDSQRSLETQIATGAVARVEAEAAAIEHWLQSVLDQVGSIAQADVLKSGDTNAQLAYLRRVVNEVDFLAELMIVDLRGNMVVTNGDTGNIASRDYFQAALQGRRPSPPLPWSRIAPVRRSSWPLLL